MNIFNSSIKSQIDFAVKSGISRIDSYYLMSYLLDETKEYIFTHISKRISILKISKWKKIVKKRESGIPANYITGLREFYSLNFNVNRSVLIPRPETELLVDEIVELKPSSMLDIGTGSGNIAVSVKYHLPECNVTAVDISRSALRIARKNCKLNIGRLAINFARSDFCSKINGKFDTIVSNPPYIPEKAIDNLQIEVSRYEPRLALAGGYDGLNSYQKILTNCRRNLKSNGRILLEVSGEVLDGVIRIADSNGYEVENLKNDYSNKPRVIVLKLKKI